MWTSLRSGASAHVGSVHAALVGDCERHRDPAVAPLHLRGAYAYSYKADRGDFGSGGGGGEFAVWMIPQLFAYAVNYPAQSRIMVMAWIAAAALVLHTLFSWLLILEFWWGLVSAVVVLNASWWFIDIGQLHTFSSIL
ncbi:Protein DETOXIFICATION 33 [Glycine soja]|uniref:Protein DETOXIFICATION 33 n=1 Tax=Glycine soja TaxID=3848 RepID=A0A445H5T7_GLYSO|nr:Protein DETOXIFICATION 33 [Glycine soja]